MQAVILAAGMGRRLGHYTKDNTKCMVPVGGRTLIQRMLDSLTRHPLSRIVLVVGYKSDNLKAHVGESWNGVELAYVHNEIYEKTNNIYSLYLARDYLLKEPTILLESDLIFDDEVLDTIINDPRESLVLVAKFQSWMDGTVVNIGEESLIKEYISGRNFKFAKSRKYYKTVNIYKFSVEFANKRYLPFLEAYIQSVGENEYYEQVLSVINFLDARDLRACILKDDHHWYEIDDKQDLDNAEVLFAENRDRLARFQERYGGYWRYPELTDYCYLVNPYFPPKRFKEEMKSNLSILISEYPSGQKVQNLLASQLFNVHRESILVGNGAAELIRIMMSRPDIITGFILPTFSEYHHHVETGDSRFFIPDNPNFQYGIEELKSFAKGLDRLIIINPDNPSGNFIPKKNILELAAYLRERSIQLILDESFIDFSEDGINNSLIHDDILGSFPNLVVVRSISKSYAVPGLRLGILASSDRDFLKGIERGIPIWNINSFAEFFLQIIGKYHLEYLESCRKIVVERTRFHQELMRLAGVRPIRSQANYITCQLLGGMKATTITERLLNSHNLFIKDLTGKKGIPADKEYVRLAIRRRSDNNKLLSALARVLETC